MSENTTKQFLDKEGLNALWDKICNTFSHNDHTHDRFTSDIVHFDGAIHICKRSEYRSEYDEETGEEYETDHITGIYFSDNVEDDINEAAYTFIREEKDDRLRVHSNFELKLSTGDYAYGNDTSGISGPSIRLISEAGEPDTDFDAGDEVVDDTIQIHAGCGVFVNGKEVATVNQIPEIPESLPANGGNADTVDGKHASDFALKEDTPIVKGSANNSAVLKGEYQGYSNKALSQVSVSLGAATTAGLKGWYYSAITFGTNPVITLSDTQPYVLLNALRGGSWSSGTPAINVGDKISIVNDSKYDYCGEVKSISGNKITLKEALPFDSLATSLISANDPDDWTIYLPERANAGIIDMGGGAFAEGVNTQATNIGAHAEGIQTHAYGQYSHTEGFRTEAGYAAHAEGRSSIASGQSSHAEGNENTASGNASHAEGGSTIASGKFAHAEGNTTVASGEASHAEGYQTEATNNQSHAEGGSTHATGKQSHAEGWSTTASGDHSHAEGGYTTASGKQSHAGGNNSIAGGARSFVHGNHVEASNADEVAFGKYNGTTDGQIFSIGNGTAETSHNVICINNDDTANYSGATNLHIDTSGIGAADNYLSEGSVRIDTGNYSVDVEDCSTRTSLRIGSDNIYMGIKETFTSSFDGSISLEHKSGGLVAQINSDTIELNGDVKVNNTLVNDKLVFAKGTGDNSIVQVDSDCSATGKYAIATGHNTTASGEYSYAEGFQSVASGYGTHAEGGGCILDADGKTSIYPGGTASGYGAHAEGYLSNASGNFSHAEGSKTTTLKPAAHSEGAQTTASGVASHAEGFQTYAFGKHSHAEGHSSTIISVDENLTASECETKWRANKFSMAYGKDSHAEGRDTLAIGVNSHAEGRDTLAIGENSHAEGRYTTADSEASHAEGHGTVASGYSSHAEGYSTVASGYNSHAEGESTIAEGENSHAEGYSTVASGYSSHAEGYSTVASGIGSHAEGGYYYYDESTDGEDYIEGGTASGDASHAEGIGTTASGNAAHAEGSKTKAESNYSHAEGYNTTASGDASHAEGYSTTASGSYSHAEGYQTEATNNQSHAEGGSTYATGKQSHAEGWSTTASGDHSHAEGGYTTASGKQSHAGGNNSIAGGARSFAHGNNVKTTHADEVAFGKYNASDEDTIFSIGIGTSENDRKNAVEIYSDGQSRFAGMTHFDSDIHLCNSGSNKGGTIYFGDDIDSGNGSTYAYIKEDPDDILNIYGDAGVSINSNQFVDIKGSDRIDIEANDNINLSGSTHIVKEATELADINGDTVYNQIHTTGGGVVLGSYTSNYDGTNSEGNIPSGSILQMFGQTAVLSTLDLDNDGSDVTGAQLRLLGEDISMLSIGDAYVTSGNNINLESVETVRIKGAALSVDINDPNTYLSDTSIELDCANININQNRAYHEEADGNYIYIENSIGVINDGLPNSSNGISIASDKYIEYGSHERSALTITPDKGVSLNTGCYADDPLSGAEHYTEFGIDGTSLKLNLHESHIEADDWCDSYVVVNDSTFEVNSDGVFFNNAKLATEQYVKNYVHGSIATVTDINNMFNDIFPGFNFSETGGNSGNESNGDYYPESM